MNEQWRPVVGFEGLYEVSNLGRVRSADGAIRQPYANKNGYLRIDLYRQGRRVKRYVHRLVLEAFVGPCPLSMEGCHWDGAPSNNILGNLRWDTPSANWEDARRHGTARVRDTHHWSKLTSADISAIRQLRATGLLQKEIAERFKVCQQSISYILKRAA